MPADDLQPSQQPTSITAEPPAPSPSTSAITADKPAVPLAPLLPAAPDTGRIVFGDLLLAFLALVLAAEVAIKPVFNNDVLMHLATGRDLLAGKYNPLTGQEPYSYTTGGSGWVNHSWLYDVVFCLLHSAGGFTLLIAVKAGLSFLLGLVLLRISRAGPNLWGPALLAACGIVAVSARLYLQPAVVSYLFLALTLYFLQRGGRYLYEAEPEKDPPAVTWKRYWPILPLFIAWVNLDEWFFLGPLTVALYALGQALQRGSADRVPRAGEVQALATMTSAGLLVCLLNPSHIFAFTLPVHLRLSDTASILGSDYSPVRSAFIHSFHPLLFTTATISAAHLTFFLLGILTVLSFALNWRGFRCWRAVLAAVFFLLAAWTTRAVPFFAILAVPIIAHNFQEAVRPGSLPRRRRDPFAQLGRVFGLFLLLGLIVADWPGWLQRQPYERYRVSFANELDPSLENTANALKKLSEDGILPAGPRGFHLSPDIGNALAYYAPEIKGYFDSRYSLFGKTARDYVAGQRGLAGVPFTRPPEGVEPWGTVLERLEADHVVVYSDNPERLRNPLWWLTLVRRERKLADWVILYQDGHAAIFGNAAARPLCRQHEIDFERLAYAPSKEAKAPANGMPRLPSEPLPWAAFTDPPSMLTPETAEAFANLLQFLVRSKLYREDQTRQWQDSLAALTLTGGIPSGVLAPPPWWLPLLAAQGTESGLKKVGAGQPLANPLEGYSLYKLREYQQYLDDGPPENLLLAIRSARRALHERPNDHAAHEYLGAVYYEMLAGTRERALGDMVRWMDERKSTPTAGLVMLRQLRHVQTVSALRSALICRKDLGNVHQQLANLYARLSMQNRRAGVVGGFEDLELEHLQAEMKYSRQASRGSPETQKEATQRLEGLSKHVENQRTRFDIGRQRAGKVEKSAARAFEMSLAGRALEVLLDADETDITSQGARLQIELALMTGRIREVQTWMEEVGEKDWRKRLGDFGYLWMSTLLAAGRGDYARADHCLKEIASASANNSGIRAQAAQAGVVVRGVREPVPMTVPMRAEEAASLIVAKAIADAAANPSEMARLEKLQLALVCLSTRVEEANVHFLRALLALEEGDMKRAEEALLLADKLPDIFRGNPPQGPRTPVQELARIHLAKLRQK